MAKNEPNKPHFGSPEGERVWEEECKAARETQKYEYAVAPKCTVPQEDGPTLHQRDEVDPSRIEGGMPQVIKWIGDGYILKIDERKARTNRGDVDIVLLKVISHGGRIWDKGDGVDFDELTVPATEGYKGIGANGRYVEYSGSPERPGIEIGEDWIERGIGERMKLIDKARAAAKRVLSKSSKTSSKAAG
jgi:hypothetical protein